MRNKIRQMMKKEDGFTLVELLAVIVILGIIVAIAIPAVGRVVDDARSDSRDAETELVIDAARIYFTTTGAEGDASVQVSELISGGYLEPRSGENPRGSVFRRNGQLTYEPD